MSKYYVEFYADICGPVKFVESDIFADDEAAPSELAVAAAVVLKHVREQWNERERPIYRIREYKKGPILADIRHSGIEYIGAPAEARAEGWSEVRVVTSEVREVREVERPPVTKYAVAEPTPAPGEKVVVEKSPSKINTRASYTPYGYSSPVLVLRIHEEALSEAVSIAYAFVRNHFGVVNGVLQVTNVDDSLDYYKGWFKNGETILPEVTL